MVGPHWSETPHLRLLGGEDGLRAARAPFPPSEPTDAEIDAILSRFEAAGVQTDAAVEALARTIAEMSHLQGAA